MTSDSIESSLSGSLRTQLAAFVDIVVVIVYLAVADVVLISSPDGAALRAIVAIPLLFFVPGFALLTAFYPRRPTPAATTAKGTGTSEFGAGSLNWVERLVLSVGLSVAVVSMLGVVLTVLGLGLTAELVQLAAVEGVIVVGLTVGLVRRIQLPPDERFRVPYLSWFDEFGSAVSPSLPLADRLLNAAVLVLVLVSVGTLAFAVVSPPAAEQHTNVMVLSENESGDYVAGGYPSELTPGEETSLVVEITNHEDEPTAYTVVPVLQRVQREQPSASVVEQQRFEPFEVSVAPGESVSEQRTYVPAIEGTDLRFAFLVYRGPPPEDPTVDSSYRHVYIWVNVSSG